MILSPAQVLRHRTLFEQPCVKIVKQIAIPYKTPIIKSNFERKSIGTIKTKLHSCKHKNGNVSANENKRSERANTKMHKMPRHNVKNNNYVKLKHLSRNVPFVIQVET